ncbi:MAG: hypothetical protein K2X63_03665, partial [Burkholderiaceae bacterium]|nr:hypothetical protein [Burkholderiaceae bacterium]
GPARHDKMGARIDSTLVDILFSWLTPAKARNAAHVFGLFHPDAKKGKLTNDRHHRKTDLAVVQQERQPTFGQYTNQQRRRNSYQTNLVAAQPRSSLLAQVPALTDP